ncbi:alanyl-tRNA editing protein [Bacillus canaveralius]|uniref:Alanyl-tRNA editing protein n=1 Tax=Bacillus canaveralius TaxID=1403243 RepID=A0A2N5GQW4_9BACI|nr:DHHA1 domain-containing protein [Bacillus canaveralius]PLR85627.1 alanyl-tRNA editing protein [Bacillus canaveralius]PLR94712.1 alanyl-tRNA editing protein [Bacillus canaveralius]RSK50491.1 alanyl-tRNA editing protein [Bacillus canaveralius]
MTTKLYYQDPYFRTFATRVTKQANDDAGNWFVVVEETAFYPTGGGQPHDVGTLDGVTVLNVEEIDGEIRHYVDGSLPLHEEIKGVIDWQRRFDHMQQHAGQHILSAAFEELFDFETVSFHLGKELLTIDLNIGELTEEAANEAEKRANQIILENRPIETKWVTEEELSQFPLRKQPTVTENIRLVIIQDFDYNGCGGTHPKATGEVTAIKILGWERQRKRIRIQFVCGNRVLDQLHKKEQTIRQLCQLLNAPEQELPAAARRLLESGAEKDKSLQEIRETLLRFEVKDLLEQSEKLIAKVYQNRTIQELQMLARLLTAEKDELTVLLVTENDSRLQLVCARGSQETANMKQIIADVLPIIAGKGGGNEALAQGGGEALVSGQELLDILLDKVK